MQTNVATLSYNMLVEMGLNLWEEAMEQDLEVFFFFTGTLEPHRTSNQNMLAMRLVLVGGMFHLVSHMH